MESEVGRGWRGVTRAGVTCPTSFNILLPRLKGLCLFLRPPMHPSLFLLFPLALDLTLGHVTRPDTAPPMPQLTEPFSVGGTLELLVMVVPGQDPAGRGGLVLTSSNGRGGRGGQLHPLLPVHVRVWEVLFWVSTSMA